MRSGGRVDFFLALAVVVTFAPVVSPSSAQPASRYALTAALAHGDGVDIGAYEDTLGIDRAVYGGELRSDKAPGQPLLGVPFYIVARWAGAEPATHLRAQGNLGIWWQTLWCATLPFAALLVLMRRTAARFAPRHALTATIAIGFGASLLPHAVNLYGQTLAALLGFTAWTLVEADDHGRRRLLFGGALAGLAVMVEYHATIIVVVLAVFCARRAISDALRFASGAMPPLVLLAIYETLAFGAPWRLPYAYWQGGVPAEMSLPGISGWSELMWSDHGLILAAPIVVVGVAGAVLWLSSDHLGARHCAIGAVVAGLYLVLSAGWSGTAFSEDPGPRYLIPSLPFLAVPLALVWERLRIPAVVAAIIGAATAVPAALTMILSPSNRAPVLVGLERVARGDFVPTLWSMAFGRWGVALHVVTAVIAMALLARGAWRQGATVGVK